LGEIQQRGGKRVIAFAVEGNMDADAIASNTFEMEWPPKSGRRQRFPEVDRAEWFNLKRAREKILASSNRFSICLMKPRPPAKSGAAQNSRVLPRRRLQGSLQQSSDLWRS
jgi:predicted NUDIX family NTP pyrophosphohydrolase